MLHTRDDLLSLGMTTRQITSAVRGGRLVRLRRDRYARPGVDAKVADAVRIGGRITCLSLLQMVGVFVLKVSTVHVQVTPHSSRLGIVKSGDPHLHWTKDPDCLQLHATSLRTAIKHSVRCQPPRAAVATLDSLVHHGLITRVQLEELFRELPPRFGTLVRLVDASAESGPETLVRLMLRSIGVSFETQVFIEGVGRVDFVVEGWLVIECDSKEFHEGRKKQKQDRGRDLAAARLGYVTVRPLAADILHRPDATQQTPREIIDMMGPNLAPESRSHSRRDKAKRVRDARNGAESTYRPEN
jgi:very-short-patch-repair endonuclease